MQHICAHLTTNSHTHTLSQVQMVEVQCIVSHHAKGVHMSLYTISTWHLPAIQSSKPPEEGCVLIF